MYDKGYSKEIMPLPRPQSDETEEDFLDRCVSNDTMEEEFENEDQRYAVCQSIWDNKSNKRSETMKYKSFQAEMEVVDINKGIFEGYASVFDVVDSYGDNIKQGAFRKTLQEGSDRVKVLYLHMNPFGKPIEMREDSHGLYTKTQATPTKENQDRLQYIKDGVVDSLSIGYDLVEGKFDENENGGYDIYELKLWEYSPVIWGANPLANIARDKEIAQLTKSMNNIQDGFLNDDIEQVENAIKDIKALTGKKPEASTSVTDESQKDNSIADIKSLCEEVRSYKEATHLKKELDEFAKNLRR